MKTVPDFIFLSSKITADSDCSHEIKQRSLLGRKAVTNLDSVLKPRDITLPTKVSLVKVMVFSVVTCRCEIWAIKKAEHWRIDAFTLWCWRRLLKVFWKKTRSNQSILKEINPKYHWKDWCWNWSSNTLATWCKEPTYWKRPWCWGRLRVWGEGGDRGWDSWMASPTEWTWVWAKFRRLWSTGKLGMLQSMGLQRVAHDWATIHNSKGRAFLALKGMTKTASKVVPFCIPSSNGWVFQLSIPLSVLVIFSIFNVSCPTWILSFWAPKSLQMVTAAMKLKDACSLEEKLWPT